MYAFRSQTSCQDINKPCSSTYWGHFVNHWIILLITQMVSTITFDLMIRDIL